MRVAGIVLLLLLGCACDSADHVSNLEKQTQSDRDRVADYNLSEKCSKDAKEWFNSNWGREANTILLTYTNHYNKKMNKCFVVVEDHYSMGHSDWTNHTALWDIYDNVERGVVSISHIMWVDKPVEQTMHCEIDGQKCSSLDGFSELSRSYMND
ncbi:MAG TPA: hypothetical protein VJO35_18505 [Terriglobales bacterium]|nr:hypothetical protein [Terriglobales bacterium]